MSLPASHFKGRQTIEWVRSAVRQSIEVSLLSVPPLCKGRQGGVETPGLRCGSRIPAPVKAAGRLDLPSPLLTKEGKPREVSIDSMMPTRSSTHAESGRANSKHEGGFTLVEALLAIALLATLGAIVFGSLLTTTQVVDAGRAAASREQTIRRVLRLMAEELTIGVKETTFPWVGLNGTQDGQSADTLAFVTRGDGLGIQAARESEILRVIYTREGDRLIRFVRRNLYALTDESVDQVNLATKVKGFNVRYYSRQGQVWLDEWSSTGPLPTALLLEITFQEPDAEPYTIREWVTVGVS